MQRGLSLIGLRVEYEGGRAISTLGLTPSQVRQPKLAAVTTPLSPTRSGVRTTKCGERIPDARHLSPSSDDKRSAPNDLGPGEL
jgi:hypothetical protein